MRALALEMGRKPKTRSEAWDNRVDFDKLHEFAQEYPIKLGHPGQIFYDKIDEDPIQAAFKEHGWILLSMEEYSSLPDE